jgi:hypothetical protein
MGINAMDTRHGLQIGDGLKIEYNDVGHGVSLRSVMGGNAAHLFQLSLARLL